MKFFFKILGFLFLFFIFLLVFYFTFVNPNHWRIEQKNISSISVDHRRFKRIASVFEQDISHSLDISDAEFAEIRDKLSTQLRDSVFISKSQRFKSKYQVFYSVGQYPFRLEGYDAILIPKGASLRIEVPKRVPLELRFATYSPMSSGVVEVSSSQVEKMKVIKTKYVSQSQNWVEKFFDSKLRGVFFPDRSNLLDQWEAHKVNVSDDVTIKCSGAEYGCLIGDLSFYQLTEEEPKNFIVILVDTMRWDGISKETTPRIYDFFKGSSRFDNAIAPGNMTAPSTNALLSCKLAANIEQIGFAYSLKADTRESFYKQRDPSFPELFLRSGYNTAMIGNISVISEIFGIGVNHGFKNQISVEIDPFDTPLIAREAVRWLGTNGNSPFFLYVHFNGPHAPYRAPLSDLIRVSRGFSHDFDSYANFLRWTYRGEMSYADAYIGQIFEALKALKLDENTTVVLTSDHGDQHFDRHYNGNHVGRDFFGSYFDHGATLYNDEIRVPLLIRSPYQNHPALISEYVSTLDIGPTLLAQSGIPMPEYCHGKELLKNQQNHVVVSEGFRARAIIFDKYWKYVRTYEPTDKMIYTPQSWVRKKSLFMVPEELFNLSDDPLETRNLAIENSEKLFRARQIYQEQFNISHSYELIVDNFGGKNFLVVFPNGITITSSTSAVSIREKGNEILVEGSVSGRIILSVRGKLVKKPSIRFDSKEAKVFMTGQRLAIDVAPYELPAELPGESTILPPSGAEMAFLRHVEDDGKVARRIVSGNPKFDAVLREWGYLNEQ